MMLHKVKSKDRGRSRSPSTFINGKLSGDPRSAKSNKLHSKSTYFYRWGSRLNYVVPGVCGLALLVGEMVTVSPIINNVEKASAEGGPAVQTSAAGESAVQADTGPTVSLTLTGGEAYQQTTAEVGEIAYRSNVFRVGGTGMGKYIVSLNTASDKTGELVGKDNPYVTVGKVGANTTSANFGENTWGYAVSALNNTSIADASMNYNPVPSGMSSHNNSVEVAKRVGIAKADAIADSYKITFAAKLGSNLPSDHYEANVYLSVVAYPPTISEINAMQEMDSSVCTNSSENETKQLIDTRDSRIYWVTKLKDGNCWMTQNLAYNDPNGTKIDSPYNWKSDDPRLRAYYVGAHVDGSHTSTGNYYSWSSATAGSGDNMTTGNQDAPDSICPHGWQLPTDNNSDPSLKSIKALANAYGATDGEAGSSILRSDPIYFNMSGLLRNGTLNNNMGNYWTSTTSGSNSYSFFFYERSFALTYNGYGRQSGMSVRCVAK